MARLFCISCENTSSKDGTKLFYRCKIRTESGYEYIDTYTKPMEIGYHEIDVYIKRLKSENQKYYAPTPVARLGKFIQE